MLYILISLVIVILGRVDGNKSGAISKAIFKNCLGPTCRLHMLPGFKEFVNEELLMYDSVFYESVPECPPEIVFLNNDEEVVKRISVKDKSIKDIKEILKRHGFHKIYGDDMEHISLYSAIPEKLESNEDQVLHNHRPNRNIDIYLIVIVLVLCIICCCGFCSIIRNKAMDEEPPNLLSAVMASNQQQQLIRIRANHIQQQSAPSAPPYPVQDNHYLPQPTYPSQGPYPGTYATSLHMGGDQHPTYSQRQLAFNPNYAH
ncbi:unnamed protein product, partial [Meganyctiphanes norvegica]